MAAYLRLVARTLLSPTTQNFAIKITAALGLRPNLSSPPTHLNIHGVRGEVGPTLWGPGQAKITDNHRADVRNVRSRSHLDNQRAGEVPRSASSHFSIRVTGTEISVEKHFTM